MAWLTTAEIKTYLRLTDATYDTQIDLYNPVAQSEVERFILPSTITELPLKYHPKFAKLVFLMINEGSIDVGSSNIKSQSFDGESVTYGDVKSTDIAITSDQQILKFLPLRTKRYW